MYLKPKKKFSFTVFQAKGKTADIIEVNRRIRGFGNPVYSGKKNEIRQFYFYNKCF